MREAPLAKGPLLYYCSFLGMEHQQIISLFKQGQRRVALLGCPTGFLALILSRLARSGSFPQPLVLVTANEEEARQAAQDLSFFMGKDEDAAPMDLAEVMHLPQVETSPYAEISPDRVAVMQRMGVLFRLSQGYSSTILVVSAPALRRRLVPRQAVSRLSDLIEVGEELDRDDTIRRLMACGFNRAPVVEDPGTTSVRGGIIDLYPPLNRFPVRVELFGDLVESIRLFDPASQRTLRDIDEVIFYPVRETIPTGKDEVKSRILEAADRVSYPSSKTRMLREELESGREFFGIEALTPAFHDQMVPLTDYLPDGTLWILNDPEAIQNALEQEDRRSEMAYATRLEEGRLTFPPEDFFLDAATLGQIIERQTQLQRHLIDPPDETPRIHCDVQGNADVEAEIRRARAERGEEILKALVARLRAWQEEARPVLIAGGGAGQVQRLNSLLKGYGVRCELEQRPGLIAADGADQIWLCPGDLSAGFRQPNGLVVLAEQEIFGPKARKRSRRSLAEVGVGDLSELREKDPVVHAEHGVGLYQGLRKLGIEGVPADFLLLEYAGGDKLYVPVYRMNQVQKYVGTDKAAPRLDRLGGITWAKKKSKVKADVRKMAEDLLQLYAQRAALDGHAYPPADALYHEFEATFPFDETPDQASAVDAVQRDLTAARPMDRLVCGDVGFGKTEVALRAAFSVAMSGKQVAVLAPTTVLVEQHYRTFIDRMGPYPLRVEYLSRFRPRADQAEVINDLAAGKVDVVIGTHRLIQPDVRFKELGLLVIDEEHRFGVSHKERLKRLRTQVDVLTMTATPIPRTLHMGLTGLRSISIIATPPVDRLAIRTFISRFDDTSVAEAVRRELDRGGQVFFVHNRVKSIDQWAERLAALVPEARVGVGHGQMDARRLERVMVDFVAGRYDVLVCSAIIESGLDIPRANTMFINRADQFGLAQLYQLRGRIGRSRHRAYCYLLVPGFDAMTAEARQRLDALQSFTELGSGFSVASHDLEIRGAGELLGAKQSGQIAAVGFETYARILEEAVAELKGEPITRETDPELNTRVPAFIPDSYVEDTGQRLELYKRLSNAAVSSGEDAIVDLLAEIQDRYGPRPSEVDALGQLMAIKGLAARIGATVVDLSETRLSLTLDESTPLDPQRIIQLVEQRRSAYRLTPEMRLIRTLSDEEQRDPLQAAKKILHDLEAHAN